jgi:transcriptional regulator with XRE-family HTH domain
MIRAGIRIQKKRRERGLTVQQLASCIGVSRSYLTLIENGKRSFPKKLVIPLAKSLKLSKKVVYQWFLQDAMEELRL